MMILYKRIKAFCIANGSVFIVSYISWNMNQSSVQFQENNKNNIISPVKEKLLFLNSYFFSSLFRIIFFIALITFYSLKKKPIISNQHMLQYGRVSPKEKDKRMAMLLLIIIAFLESFSSFLAFKMFRFSHHFLKMSQVGFLSFILNLYCRTVIKFFLFELIFDFFHYWSHRFLHKTSWLCVIHKNHHKFNTPSPLMTYYHHPLDYILSNCIPILLTFYFLQCYCHISYSEFEYHLLISYKTFIEVAGHAGIETHATSFPLCTFLPSFSI